jgi:hypothetical protein
MSALPFLPIDRADLKGLRLQVTRFANTLQDRTDERGSLAAERSGKPNSPLNSLELASISSSYILNSHPTMKTHIPFFTFL